MNNWYILFLISILISCSQDVKEEDKNVFYTCSMDPQVMLKKPGRCPICKMDLTRIVVDPNQALNELQLSDRQIKLANISVDVVNEVLFGKEKILNATLTENENNTKAVSTRMAGRIENLYVQYVGQRITKGTKLYDIYSEELLNAQREYLLAYENKDDNAALKFKGFLNAALKRLYILGFNEEQIQKLNDEQYPSPYYTVVADYDGFVSELNVTQGDYVQMGKELFKISDLSTLWVEAQLFGNEILHIKNNAEVKVNIPGFPGKSIFAKIDFMSPEMIAGTRINLIRAEIPNADYQLKPGMAALLSFSSDIKKTIAIPSESVIIDESMNTVWVQTKKGVFQPRTVETGIQGTDSIEIVSGVKVGDSLVISGTYLLNSEYRIRKGNRMGHVHAE